MKKIALLFAFLTVVIVASAQTGTAVYLGTLKARAGLLSTSAPNTNVYVEEINDGTLSLKVYNLIVNFLGKEYAIGNVEINNFTKNGSTITTAPKSETEDNIIITAGDAPGHDWLFTSTSTQYTGSATMTNDRLTFSIPIEAELLGKPTTINLSYDGSRVATHIDTIAVDATSDQPSYNISGQRTTSSAAHGIIITGGKKIFR